MIRIDRIYHAHQREASFGLAVREREPIAFHPFIDRAVFLDRIGISDAIQKDLAEYLPLRDVLSRLPHETR